MQIDNDVPLPAAYQRHYGGGRQRLYPWSDLEIGQSFFAPVNQLTSWQWEKITGFRFATRKVTEAGVPGVRAWRIA